MWDEGCFPKPAQARQADIPVEDWAVAHTPWAVLVQVPKKLGLKATETTFNAFGTCHTVTPTEGGWELVCETTAELPGDWLSNKTTEWPMMRGVARDSWYVAGDCVDPPTNKNRHRDWVFYRPLWIVFEKLNRELATEYARRESGDKSLKGGPREPVIPGLRGTFTIALKTNGYTIDCHGLADQLRSLPAWNAFD